MKFYGAELRSHRCLSCVGNGRQRKWILRTQRHKVQNALRHLSEDFFWIGPVLIETVQQPDHNITLLCFVLLCLV